MNHKREESTNAVMMDALTKQWKINSVWCMMGLRVIIRNVAIKAVPTEPEGRKKYVPGMEESEGKSIADMKDVQTNVLMEECASDTGLRNTFAVIKDAQTKPEGRKEYVSGSLAAMMGVLTRHRKQKSV